MLLHLEQPLSIEGHRIDVELIILINGEVLFPVCCGFTMPTYQTVSQEEGDGDSSSATSSSIQSNKHAYKSKLIYILAFFYFTFSCGMESFFQSQTFTFGICGPHQLKPKEVRLLTCSSISYYSVIQAAVLTTVYFSCFLLGRWAAV